MKGLLAAALIALPLLGPGALPAPSHPPYTSAVALTYPNGVQVCSGTLVAAQWVLSAAHCVDSGVVDGVVFSNGTSTTITEYHPSPAGLDLALGKLETAATAAEGTPVPVRNELPTGEVIIMGAGSGGRENPSEPVYAPARIITPGVGFVQREIKVVPGDSGGAVLKGGELAGVITHRAGQNEDDAGTYFYYQDLISSFEWINATTRPIINEPVINEPDSGSSLSSLGSSVISLSS